MGLSDSERLGLGIPIRGIGVYGRFNVNQSGEGHGLTDRRFDLVDDRREITKAQIGIEFHLGAHQDVIGADVLGSQLNQLANRWVAKGLGPNETFGFGTGGFADQKALHFNGKQGSDPH